MNFAINWNLATVNDRQMLYEVVQKLRSTNVKYSWDYVFREALGVKTKLGIDTEKNFKKGLLSRTKCASIYRWLCKDHIESAREYDVLFFKGKPQALSWLNLLSEHGKFRNIDVPVLNGHSFALNTRKSKEPMSKRVIKRFEDFCFEVDAPLNGQLLILEEYAGHWNILPLYDDITTQELVSGKQWVPNINGNPDPLEEEVDMGKHRYAFFIAGDDDFADAISCLPKDGMIAPNLLNDFATAIGELKTEWHLLRINVIFED
ncbi:MAG: hypothetical protein HRU28_10975 [Rhizobiales bacterium]|nr:hypothetical protein [Hyphomicrobiales bacterium]